LEESHSGFVSGLRLGNSSHRHEEYDLEGTEKGNVQKDSLLFVISHSESSIELVKLGTLHSNRLCIQEDQDKSPSQERRSCCHSIDEPVQLYLFYKISLGSDK
jgi:hypothetical protein